MKPWGVYAEWLALQVKLLTPVTPAPEDLIPVLPLFSVQLLESTVRERVRQSLHLLLHSPEGRMASWSHSCLGSSHQGVGCWWQRPPGCPAVLASGALVGVCRRAECGVGSKGIVGELTYGNKYILSCFIQKCAVTVEFCP